MRLRHIFWNLFGLVTPAIVALVTIPLLLSLIGSERFGFLALAWGLIGYAGILDFGIGRATNQRVSTLRGTVEAEEVSDVVASAIRLTLSAGGLGMILLIIATLLGVYRLVHAVSVPAREIEIAMYLLAVALPMQSVSATYKGVNEAYLNFKKISILRVVLGIANFGAPYVMALFSVKIYWLVLTLVLSRGIALFCFRHFAYECISQDGPMRRGRFNRQHALSLWRFGGWFAVSSIVSPFLVQSDRFAVGALISASAVTMYVIPYEAVTKALLLVGAVTTVAFPVLTNLVRQSPAEASALFYRWLLRISAIMLVLMALLAYTLPMLLKLWIGAKLDPHSVTVGQVLCIGVFFFAIGTMYVALFHAYGKTKVTAILNLIEIPVFFVALYVLVTRYGVVGAAAAWVFRAAFDTIALAWLSRRNLDDTTKVAHCTTSSDQGSSVNKMDEDVLPLAWNTVRRVSDTQSWQGSYSA